MTDRTRDTIWFGTPAGGKLKVTWEGYSTEHVEKLIQDFVDQGWVVLYQTHRIVGKPRLRGLEWWIFGIALGVLIWQVFW